MKRPTFLLTRLAAGLALAASAAHAPAQSVSWSAFGTVGGAISDQSWRYQNHIDNRGTIERDSVFGAQLDANFSEEWSGTVQAKLAPTQRHLNGWDLSASWAFLSWRPNNEWLVRGGKLRMPLYLFSENLDVGQSYDFARMPTETYAIAATTDLTGLYVTHFWNLGEGELSLDAFRGSAKVYHRFYSRDSGPSVHSVDADTHGGVLSWREDDLTLRAAWLHADTELGSNAYPTMLGYQNLAPGFGLYLPNGFANRIRNDVLALGMDWRLGQGWRLITEFERNVQHDTTMGANTYGGHIGLLKTVGRWTPYGVVSAVRSVDGQRHLKKALNDTASQYEAFAGVSSDAAQAASAQRQLSDGIQFYDQHTLALGTSYAVTTRSKLKAEWAHTWIGDGSIMVDSPSGSAPVAHKGINVLSLSYNFAF